MDLSFITVNYHHSDKLAAMLNSIYSTVSGIDFEVIVINNSFRDRGMRALAAKFPDIRLVTNRLNQGFAKANNQGADLSRGKYLFFLNPDTVLTEGAVYSLCTYLESESITGILAPKVLNPDGSLQHSCRRFPTIWAGLFNKYSLISKLFPNNPYTSGYLMTDFDHDHIKEVDWVSGCGMMIPRRAFAEAGRFDENYFLFNEDVDLCQAMRSEGLKVVYYPEAVIYHHIISSNGKMDPSAIIKRHTGMAYYYKKHHSDNVIYRGLVNSMIALRCLAQILLNRFK